MDTKALKKFEEAVVSIFGIIGVVALCFILVKAWQKQAEYYQMVENQQQREAQWHEEWKKERGCVHTGYYGKYGSQRTYSCNGTVLVEEGIRMYDKERGVYVKNW